MPYTGKILEKFRLNALRLLGAEMPVCANPSLDSATTASPITLNTTGQMPKSIMVDSPGACDLEIWGSIDNVKFKFLGRYEIAEPSYFNLMEKIKLPWQAYQWLKFDNKAGMDVTIKSYSAGLG